LQDSKTNETKSSAGDKYETGRAMIQNQEDLYRRQQLQTRAVLNNLLNIQPDKECSRVENGALILLPMGMVYIGAGMGKLEVDGTSFFGLSLASPLGVALRWKAAGDEYLFQDQTQTILNVY
jgi:hypothetical protein